MYNPMQAKHQVCFLLHFPQGVDIKLGLAAIGAVDITLQQDHCTHMQATQMPVLHAELIMSMSMSIERVVAMPL